MLLGTMAEAALALMLYSEACGACWHNGGRKGMSDRVILTQTAALLLQAAQNNNTMLRGLGVTLEQVETDMIGAVMVVTNRLEVALRGHNSPPAAT